LLLIFDIDPSSKKHKKVLSDFGIQELKTLWKQIWTDWMTNPIGLQANILAPFLSRFDSWMGFKKDQIYVCAFFQIKKYLITHKIITDCNPPLLDQPAHSV